MHQPKARPVVLLSVPEAAEYLTVTERYMRRLVAQRLIRYRKVGRLIRFELADLNAYRDRTIVEPVARSA